MFLFNISKRDLKNRKMIFLLLGMLFSVIVCISIYFFIPNNYKKKLTYNESESLLALSYYTEYDETVISNKTVNTYSVKEWNDGNKHKFEYLDRLGNKFHIIKNEDKIIIYNENEKNSLTLDNVITQYNLASFSSLASIYKSIIEGKNDCECAFEIEENEKNIFVILNRCKQDNANCLVNKLLNINNVALIKLEINKVTGVPEVYTVFDENKKERICIVYNKFQINNKIDENIFK